MDFFNINNVEYLYLRNYLFVSDQFLINNSVFIKDKIKILNNNNFRISNSLNEYIPSTSINDNKKSKILVDNSIIFTIESFEVMKNLIQNGVISLDNSSNKDNVYNHNIDNVRGNYSNSIENSISHSFCYNKFKYLFEYKFNNNHKIINIIR